MKKRNKINPLFLSYLIWLATVIISFVIISMPLLLFVGPSHENALLMHIFCPYVVVLLSLFHLYDYFKEKEAAKSAAPKKITLSKIIKFIYRTLIIAPLSLLALLLIYELFTNKPRVGLCILGTMLIVILIAILIYVLKLFAATDSEKAKAKPKNPYLKAQPEQVKPKTSVNLRQNNDGDTADSAAEVENPQILLLEKANKKIKDRGVSADIDAIKTLTEEIGKYAAEERNRAQVEKFYSYYIPTLIKLLDKYAELEDSPIKTEKSAAIKNEIAQAVKNNREGFTRLYENMLSNTALDIYAETEALNGSLYIDGLLNVIEFDK